MEEKENSKVFKCIIIRRWARGIGVFAASYWMLTLLLHMIDELVNRNPIVFDEGFILGCLILLAFAGVVVAWKRERRGGIIMLIAGFSLCIFAYVTAGSHKGFAMLVSGVPFLISGSLFLAYTYCKRAASGHRSAVSE